MSKALAARLWLVRHARVLLPPGVCYGASDVAADWQHTQQTAQRLAHILPSKARLRVSALGRAQALAQALSALRPDCDSATVDARINEIDFGHWEGVPWNTIPELAFAHWMADFAHHRFGGQESTQELLDRVALALADEQNTVSPQDRVWITHAGVIRAVQFLLTEGRGALREARQWPRSAPEPGEWRLLSLPATPFFL